MALDLFTGKAPKLLSVRLCGVALKRWNSGLLSGLRSLTLRQLYELGPSLPEMLDILRASPELERLILIGIRLPFNATLTRPSTVFLHSLLSLELEGVHVRRNELADLLDSIRAPHCTTFSIYGDESTQHQPSVFPSIISFIHQPFNALIQSEKRVVFSISQPQIGSFGRDASNRFYVWLDRVVSFFEVADWLTASLSSVSSSLDVELTGHDGSHTDILAILQRLPAITTLALSAFQDRDYMDIILRELSSPSISITEHPSWLCPKLQSVCFSDSRCTDPDLVLKLIEGRA